MSSKNLVICDPEIDYAVKLAAFINEKKELAFQVKVCRDLDQLVAIQKDLVIDLLLISDRISHEDKEDIRAKTVVELLSNPLKTMRANGIGVYKYQAAEEICCQLIQLYPEERAKELLRVPKKEIGKVIGIYSPVHRAGQTSFAIKKGKELANKYNVLYLNLEMYAGVGGHFPEAEKNLSMLLYYAKQESGNPGLLLPSLVKQMGHLDYVPPVVYSEELKEVTQEEWIWLFSQILETSIYEILILDLSECIQGMFEILKFCDTIFLPNADDLIAASKLAQYEQVLYQLGYGDIWERMIVCDTGRTTS